MTGSSYFTSPLHLFNNWNKMLHLPTILVLVSPLLASPTFPFFFNLQPGIGGGLSGEPKANASAGFGVSVKPNWNLTSNLGKGIGGAINGTMGALAGGTKTVGQSAVNGVADTLNTAFNGVSNLGNAMGGAAAGAVGAVGNAITGVGESLGPLNFGANANANAQLKAAFDKFVGAILQAGGNSKNDPNVIAALRDLIGAVLAAAVGASGNVDFGPLGYVGAGAGISAIIDPIVKGIFGVTL